MLTSLRLISVVFCAFPLLGVAPKEVSKGPEFVALGEIDAEADAKMTVVTVRLDQKPAWSSARELQDHGSFLQLVLPDTLVPEPGKFIATESPYIKKIAVFQLNQKDAGVRFFVDADATAIRAAAEVELLDKRLVLTIDHAKLKPLLSTASADTIIAKTAVSRDIPPPADRIKGDGKRGPKSEAKLATGQGLDLREKLTSVAMFLGGLLLLAGLAMMVRPIVRRHKLRAAADRGEDAPEAPVGMRTIGHLPIAARQKLQLVQIGDEKILIGVTADAISYITTVGKKEATRGYASAAAASFGKMIEMQAPASQQPALKKLPGNDEATLRAKAARATIAQVTAASTAPAPVPAPAKVERTEREGRPAAKPTRPAPTRVAITVGEDGITNHSAMVRGAVSAPPPAKRPDEGPRAVEDVTRLIREKLKSLKSMG